MFIEFHVVPYFLLLIPYLKKKENKKLPVTIWLRPKNRYSLSNYITVFKFYRKFFSSVLEFKFAL